MDESDIIKSLKDKLSSSAKFFHGGRFALEIEGRPISQDAEKEIVCILKEQADIEVVCILSKDPDTDQRLLKAIRKSVPPKENDTPVCFHHGSLKAGDYLTSDKTIIVFGNANVGSTISSDKDVFVYGFLKGKVSAGNKSNNAKICAKLLLPETLEISGVRANDDILKQLGKSKNTKAPRKISLNGDNSKFIISDIEDDDLA